MIYTKNNHSALLTLLSVSRNDIRRTAISLADFSEYKSDPRIFYTQFVKRTIYGSRHVGAQKSFLLNATGRMHLTSHTPMHKYFLIRTREQNG